MDYGNHPNDVRSKSVRDFISILHFDIAASAGHGALAKIGTVHYAFDRSWLDRRGPQPTASICRQAKGGKRPEEMPVIFQVVFDLLRVRCVALWCGAFQSHRRAKDAARGDNFFPQFGIGGGVAAADRHGHQCAD